MSQNKNLPPTSSDPDSATTKQKARPKSLGVFFLSCLKISAFTIGGGYVIVPLQKRRFCDELGWIEEDQILELIAIAQSSPGPVAINASTLLGYQLFGLKGGLVAVLATILPPLIILTIVSAFYELFAHNEVVRAVLRGMQAAVAALIAFTVWTMAKKIIKSQSVFLIAMMVLCLALALFTTLNPVFVLLIALGLSLVVYLVDMIMERGH